MKQGQDKLMESVRKVIVEKGGPAHLSLWESWGREAKIDFLFKPRLTNVFPQKCEVHMKRALGGAMAKLFLLLKPVFGHNKTEQVPKRDHYWQV